jgi:hypothetical protein
MGIDIEHGLTLLYFGPEHRPTMAFCQGRSQLDIEWAVAIIDVQLEETNRLVALDVWGGGS